MRSIFSILYLCLSDWIIATEYPYVAYGPYKDTWDRNLRYGPQAYGYTNDTCYLACYETYTLFSLQDNGWCACDSNLTHATRDGASSCGPNGGGWCNYIYLIVPYFPTELPTQFPSQTPSNVPSQQPSHEPSGFPTIMPTSEPTCEPSLIPSAFPTSPQTTASDSSETIANNDDDDNDSDDSNDSGGSGSGSVTSGSGDNSELFTTFEWIALTFLLLICCFLCCIAASVGWCVLDKMKQKKELCFVLFVCIIIVNYY